MRNWMRELCEYSASAIMVPHTHANTVDTAANVPEQSSGFADADDLHVLVRRFPFLHFFLRVEDRVSRGRHPPYLGESSRIVGDDIDRAIPREEIVEDGVSCVPRVRF